MITSTPSSIKPLPLAALNGTPTPADPVPAPQRGTAGPQAPSFAKLLREHQASAAPAPASAGRPPAQTAPVDAGAEPTAESPQLGRPGARSAARPPEKIKAPASRAASTDAQASAAAESRAAESPERSDRNDSAAPAAPDPATVPWPPQLPPNEGARPRLEGAEVGVEVGAGGGDVKAAPAAGGEAIRAAQDAGAAVELGAVDGRADAAGAGEPFAALLAEQPVAGADAAPPGALDAASSTLPAGTLGAAAAPADQRGASAAAPVSATVTSALGSPEFPQALGVQLSVLAKDGVQHAELHLNPADMGPVSVQIVMDGTQAHVDFGADVAQTRRAIEAGLPELASALRDAGFTLAGGGVSAHAGGRGDADGNARREGRGGAAPGQEGDADGPAPRPTRRTVNAGGLDLYA